MVLGSVSWSQNIDIKKTTRESPLRAAQGGPATLAPLCPVPLSATSIGYSWRKEIPLLVLGIKRRLLEASALAHPPNVPVTFVFVFLDAPIGVATIVAIATATAVAIAIGPGSPLAVALLTGGVDPQATLQAAHRRRGRVATGLERGRIQLRGFLGTLYALTPC